jgi:hypothetical protein
LEFDMKGLIFWCFMSVLSLTACAQPSAPPVQAHEAVEMTPEKIHPVAESIASKEKTEEKKESLNMNDQDEVEPVRGPAIPAAEFKKRVLDLIGSLEKQDDTNQANVEKKMGNELLEDRGSGGRFSMRGNITEGWSYWYFVRKDDAEPGSAVTFFLYHDEKLPEDEFDPLPKTCTLEFESFADDIKSKGFRQADSQTYLKVGDIVWAFRKNVPERNATFGVLVHLYRAENGTVDGQLCVKKIGIGTDPIHE